jgi:serine protease Do
MTLGSGVIVSPGGYVLTNAHVIARAQSITVTLADGKPVEARAVAADPRRDLAVIRFDPPEDADVPYLPLSRSDDLMIGEPVIAVGNPLGYESSLTTGVISATDRTLEFGDDVAFHGLIQTDAPINQGNSGGPLLNIKGELIGINTAIRADAQNIGFAIPTGLIQETLPELLDFQRLNRVLFGATVRQRPAAAGGEVYVLRVDADTPAAAVLRAGDRLLELNAAPIRQVGDFLFPMLQAKGGDTIALTIARSGESEQTVSIRLLDKPKPDGDALARAMLGLTLQEIDANAARRLGLRPGQGLLVASVEVDAPADALGLRPGDVVFQVADKHLGDLESLGYVLEDLQDDRAVRIGVLRGNTAVTTSIPLRHPDDTPTIPTETPKSPAPKGPVL